MSYFDQNEELARSRKHVEDTQQGGSGTDYLPKSQPNVEKLQRDLVNEINESQRKAGIQK